MWFIALLGIGALIIAKSSKAARAKQPQFALPPPQQYPQGYPPLQPAPYAPAAQVAPTPLMVLGEFVRQKKQPPPFVIQCAIAEAQQAGRNDIASDIIRMFIEPMVRQHQMYLAKHQVDAVKAGMPHTMEGYTQPQPGGGVQYQDGSIGPNPPPPPMPRRQAGGGPSDAQIQAMLDNDPQNFSARIQRGDYIDVDPGPEPPMSEPPTDARGADQVNAASPISGNSGTTIGAVPNVPALPSPIHDVDTIRWNAFCNLLARETPSFQSARHVGLYRQNKDRLRELAIDPATIVGSPERQRVALDRDLADAHVHAREGGLSRYVGRMIALPGQDDKVPITLSGVLGVIQAAGLDGAADWLEHFADRKRFRHTTQAFIRTNGVF